MNSMIENKKKPKQTNKSNGYILCLIFWPICTFYLEQTVWWKNSCRDNNLLIMISLVLITKQLFRKSGCFLWFQNKWLFYIAQLAYRTWNCKRFFFHCIKIWHLFSRILSCNGSLLLSIICLGPMSAQTINTVLCFILFLFIFSFLSKKYKTIINNKKYQLIWL